MSARASVQLMPMVCGQCRTPIPAEENEIAWACAKCGQGWLLTDNGLASITVQWAAAKSGATQARWLPFWAFAGTVTFQQRTAFGMGGGNSEPDKLWGSPQRFFIPAYALPLKQLEDMGAALLKKRLAPTPGPAQGPLSACVMFPTDALHTAEFVVLTIEAERRDKVRQIVFRINATPPELWLLPLEGEQWVIA